MSNQVEVLTFNLAKPILQKEIHIFTGSLVDQAERKADSLRPAKPDPDNAGGGMR
jgi:hypothetical protein